MTPLLRRTVAALVAAAAAIPAGTALAQDPAGEYPEVQAGDPAVDGRRVAPGTYTLRMIFSQGGQEAEIGTVTEELKVAAGENGEAVLERVQTVQSPMLGTFTDTVAMRHATLAPIRHRSHNPQRTLRLDFEGTRVVGSIAPAGGAPETVDAEFDRALFDSNPLDLVIRSLPLGEGYGARIPVYVHEMGGKVVIRARVLRAEQADAGAGRMVDAWVVEIDRDGNTGTFWIAKDTREMLRQAVNPAPGVELLLVR